MVEYEKEAEGRFPNLWLSINADDIYELIGDITTVSDAGLKDSNLRNIRKTLRPELGKRGLRPGNFSIKIKESNVGYTVDDLIKKELEEFLERILLYRSEKIWYVFDTVPLEIEYRPSTEITTNTYTLTSHKQIDRNPFFDAMNSKRNRLKGLPTVPRGIFLCDGESEMFYFREACPVVGLK